MVISRLTMLDPYNPRAYSAACFPANAGDSRLDGEVAQLVRAVES